MWIAFKSDNGAEDALDEVAENEVRKKTARKMKKKEMNNK